MTKTSTKLFGVRISPKHSLVLSKELKGKNIKKARGILEDLIKGKKSIEGRYYTNAAKKFLSALNALEANARVKNLNIEKLFIKNIKRDKASKFMRPRSLWHLRGQERRSINLVIEAEER